MSVSNWSDLLCDIPIEAAVVYPEVGITPAVFAISFPEPGS